MSTIAVSRLLLGIATFCTSATAFGQSVELEQAAPAVAISAEKQEKPESWFAGLRKKSLPFSSRGVGIFWSPESTLSSAEGATFSRQSYGNQGWLYASRVKQVEIGRGIGAQTEGYRVYNLLELDGVISPILGGNPFELDGDVNSKNNSRNYLSWAMHADAGLRIGKKDSCFAALTGGFGLNSGTQTGFKGGWFRRETSALLSAVCGPVALGFSLRNVKDADGTIGHATGSARVYVNEEQTWGLGTALSITGYSDSPFSRHLGRQPWLAFEADERQTMIRFTVEFKYDEKKRDKSKKKCDQSKKGTQEAEVEG